MTGNFFDQFDTSDEENFFDKFDPQQAEPERGIIGDIGSRLARGAVSTVELAGHALDTLGADTVGQKLVETSEGWLKDVDFLKPDASEVAGEGFVKRGIMGGVESSVPSLTGGLGGAAVGAGVGSVVPGIGTVVGGLVGGAAGALGLFGAGIYGKEKAAAIKAGLSDEEAHRHGLEQAVIEGGIEFIATPIELLTGGFGKVATQPLKSTIKDLLKTPLKTMAKNYGKTMGVETSTEMLQSGLGNEFAKKHGLAEGATTEAVLESIVPAITMSLMFGMGTQALTSLHKGQVKKALTDETVAADKRTSAVDEVYSQILPEDAELAIAWKTMATERIGRGESISIDEDFTEYAVKKKTLEKGGDEGGSDDALAVPADVPVAEGPKGVLSQVAEKAVAQANEKAAMAGVGPVGEAVDLQGSTALEMQAAGPRPPGAEWYQGRWVYPKEKPMPVAPPVAGEGAGRDDGGVNPAKWPINLISDEYGEGVAEQIRKSRTAKEDITIDQAIERVRAQRDAGDLVKEQVLAERRSLKLTPREAQTLAFMRDDGTALTPGDEKQKQVFESLVGKGAVVVDGEGKGYSALPLGKTGLAVKTQGEENATTGNKETVPAIQGISGVGGGKGIDPASVVSGKDRLGSDEGTAGGRGLGDGSADGQRVGVSALDGIIGKDRKITDISAEYGRDVAKVVRKARLDGEDITLRTAFERAGKNVNEEGANAIQKNQEGNSGIVQGATESGKDGPEKNGSVGVGATSAVRGDGKQQVGSDNTSPVGNGSVRGVDLHNGESQLRVPGQPGGESQLRGVEQPEKEPVVEHTTRKGKVIRGVVRNLSKEEAEKIDPYAFKKDGGFFVREKHLGKNDPGAKAGVTSDVSIPTKKTENKAQEPAGEAVKKSDESLGKKVTASQGDESAGTLPAIEIAGRKVNVSPPGPGRLHYQAFVSGKPGTGVLIVKGEPLTAVGSTEQEAVDKLRGKIVNGMNEEDKGAAVKEDIPKKSPDRQLAQDGKTVVAAEQPFKQTAAQMPTSVSTQSVKSAGTGEANTEDSGVELSANKRNWYTAGLTWKDIKDADPALKIKETVKAKVFPKPDYQQMVDSGQPVLLVHIFKQVYDGIAAAPSTGKVPTDDELQRYIESVHRVMTEMQAWMTDGRARQWAGDIAKSAANRLRQGPVSVMSLVEKPAATPYEALYPDGWKARKEEVYILGGNRFLKSTQPGLDEVVKATKDVDQGWPGKIEAWKKRGYSIEQIGDIQADYYEGKRSNDENFVSVTLSTAKGKVASFSIQAQSQNDAAVQTKVAEAKAELEEKYVLFGKYRKVVSAHATEQEAIAAAQEKVKKSSKDTVKDEGMSVEDAVREGIAYRLDGEDISSDRLKETFGFKGVNFGNWMKGKTNEKERQLHLNHAYDSFMDLASILNIPPKAISLDGLLGIAFGAQGNSNYAAHFVPGFNEINLTRTRGAGAVAHEWAHGLDHHFGRQADLTRTKEPFITEARHLPFSRLGEESVIREEIFDHFKNIVAAMQKRQTTPAELAADGQHYAEKLRVNIIRWAARIKGDFLAGTAEGLMVDSNGSNIAYAGEVDRILEKIKSMDVGEGKVAIGGKPTRRDQLQTSLSPALVELRDLYKKAHGRVYTIDNLKGLQSNIDSLLYQKESLKSDQQHIPQKSTDFYKDSMALDKEKGGKPYWSTNVEMFARAFASYVHDKIGAVNVKNTYLTRGKGGVDGYAPNEVDQGPINKAFDGLVAEMKTREAGDGVILYSKSAEPVAVLSGDEISAKADDDIFQKARDYFRDNLQGTTLHRDGLGDIRVTGKGWHKLKRGLKTDSLKVKLIPSIPAIIEQGAYHGRESVSGRNDDIVAFHYFDGVVTVDGKDVKAGVTVGEDSFGNLFYNLNHNAEALWEKRKASPFTQEKPEVEKPSAEDSSSSIKKSIGENGGFVNLVILDGQPASVAEVTAEQRAVIEALARSGKMKIYSATEAGKILRDAVEKRSGARGAVQGFTMPDGTAGIIPDNIGEGKLWSVARHEVGVHVGKVLQSEKGFVSLLRTIESRHDEQSATGEAIRAARLRVPKETKQEHVAEETLAYLIEDAPDTGIVRRFFAILKHVLVKMGLDPKWFTVEDLSALAEVAVWREAKQSDRLIDVVSKFAHAVKFSKGMSEAFRNWFGKSKITRNGQPAILYHGTSDTRFLQDQSYDWTFDMARPVRPTSSPFAGLGIFLGNEDIAMAHSGGNAEAVHSFYVRVENPFVITSAELERKVPDLESARVLKKRLMELDGHDGIIIKDRGQVIAFSPEQLKSATANSGEYSRTNSDVRFSVGRAEESAVSGAGSPFSLDSLEQMAKDKGSIKWLKNSKVDSTFLDRIFSTPEYYFKKFAAAGRVLKAALLRRDVRFAKEQEILGGFVTYIQKLRKDDKAAYGEANDYLVNTDQTVDGFRIKSIDDAKWTVIAPKWAVAGAYSKESAIVGEFDDERKAIEAMIAAESQAMIDKGYSKTAAQAVKLARELTNRGFDVMAADMRKIIAEAKENGLPDPFIGDGKIDEAGRYGVYVKGKSKPIALFASEKEADEMMDRAAEMISYMVVGSRKGEKSFTNLLKAKRWAQTHSGTVEGVKTFQNLTVRKRTDAEMRPLTVKQALAQMGDLRGIYFPRIRESGEYVLIATKDGENPIRKHFDIPTVGDDKPTLQKYLGQLTPIGREAKALKAEGYEVNIKRDDSPSEDVFEATRLVTSLDAILQGSMSTIDKNSAADVKAGQHINQILTMQIADIFKSRGYLSSRIKRLAGDVVWEGYETDMGKALTQYGKNVAAGTAKRDTARAMILAFTGRDYSWAEYKQEVEKPDWTEYQEIVEQRRIDERKQKNLFGDVRSFMVDVLRNDEQVDRIMGFMKGLAVLKYMGFRVSSAAVNMTNMVQGVPATIAGRTGTSLPKSMGYILSAATMYGRYRSGKGDISSEDRDIFQFISEKGWDEAQFNQEAASELRGKAGEVWNKFMTGAMYLFGAAEKANRAMTLFAAYKAVKAKNTTAEDSVIWEQAKEISDRAHGVYGKETIPLWARGKMNPLRLTYTFQKFQHNYMLNMIDLGFNRKEYKAAAYMLLSPAIMAGAGASVAGPLLFAAAGALGFGGDDPEEAFYKYMEELFGGGTFARQGIFGVAGVNIKGSLAMNLPMPADIANAGITDLAGPAGGVVADTFKGMKHLFKGEVAKGVESLLPTALGSMSKAMRESTEGITTSNYGSVFYGDEPLKADTADAFLRFLSFNPARISAIREMQWNEKQVAARYQERKSEIYSEIKRERLQGKQISPEILKSIKVYNNLVIGSGRRDISPITAISIRNMLRQNQRPSKLERARVVNEW